MKPPPPGRPYWICQVAGWGGFTAYVLGGYFLTEHPRYVSDVASIVIFNSLICPAATHGLRYWMYVDDWQLLRLSQLVPRLAAIVISLSGALTGLVAVWIVLSGQGLMPRSAALSIFFGFALGFAGWLTIYFAIHSRRRRDALQLELAVVVREAQLRSLRAQINPHFLFNCLNSLRHLIVARPDRAEAMVTGLAEILRYSLASDRQDTVTLAEELRVIDEYLEVERVRFEERLRIERDVEHAALTSRIPPMLIQTLVDNAIKHGIAELPAGGVMRMVVHRVDGRVEILVSNTGRLGPPPRETGHGLENAKERLRLIYGDAASLTLREVEGTVQARLVLPAEIA
jgi:two-component system LytT family sensor kinase